MLLALLLTVLAVQAAFARARTEPVPDIRILIDVSGSMKQNDPKRLRGPALRLLVGLLPRNARSGVWTFGQWVNMQVKLGQVTERWKALAQRESYKIHSRGLRTNIEEAIKRATFDWKRPDPRYRRSLILLTDGMVDISSDQRLNQASRQRILTRLLPRLRHAKVSIHTIALSPNADHKLLKALSRSTGGWYEYARSAGMLHRIFLRMFEKSTNTQSVPLKGNRFVIDKSVTDMTLLVFTEKDSRPVVVHTPDGKRWRMKHRPARVKWFQEKGYTLITVPRPPPGKWFIEAPVSRDNRVMVVTNLRLHVSKLPNFMLRGEKLVLRSHLLKKGKPIRDKRFLGLARFLLDVQMDEDSRQSFPIHDDGKAPDAKAGDGIYTIAQPLNETGRYQLTIIARGPTFQRQKIHHVQVYGSPVVTNVSQDETGKPVSIDIHAKEGVMVPKYTLISIRIDTGEKPFVKATNGNRLKTQAPASLAGHTMTVIVHGKRFSGETIKWKRRIKLPGTPPAAAPAGKPHKPAKKAEKTVHEKPRTKAHAKPDEHAKSDKHAAKDGHAKNSKKTAHGKPHKEKKKKKKKRKKKRNWLKIILMIVLINGLLIGAAVGGWIWWKKRSARSAIDEMDKDDE